MDEKELCLAPANRAFQYQDGFFETIMVHHGKLRFWHDHLDRMQQAARALCLAFPQEMLDVNRLEDMLLLLAETSHCSQLGRIKLKVWRSGGGLYTPQSDAADWLATVQPAPVPQTQALHIGICQGVHTLYSPFSHIKGPNALLYVMASREKQQRQLDDVLLLNRQHLVAELTSANIFWLKEGILYTPALDTGCVNGIARRNILRWAAANKLRIREAYFQPERLYTADAVLAANVTGIRSIVAIEGQGLTESPAFIGQLQEALYPQQL